MDIEKLEATLEQSQWVEVSVLRGYETIAPVVEQLPPGCYICGGYVRWMCSPHERPKKAQDVDVYCKNQTVFETALQIVTELGFKAKHENDNAISMYRHPTYGFILQLIKPFRVARIITNGSIEEILGNFDFTVVRIALKDSKTAIADVDFIEDETAKILILKNIHCPVSSLLRCVKYGKKGYSLRPSQAFKLFVDWDERPDSYKRQIVEFFAKEDPTVEEIEHLEKLMNID